MSSGGDDGTQISSAVAMMGQFAIYYCHLCNHIDTYKPLIQVTMYCRKDDELAPRIGTCLFDQYHIETIELLSQPIVYYLGLLYCVLNRFSSNSVLMYNTKIIGNAGLQTPLLLNITSESMRVAIFPDDQDAKGETNQDHKSIITEMNKLIKILTVNGGNIKDQKTSGDGINCLDYLYHYFFGPVAMYKEPTNYHQRKVTDQYPTMEEKLKKFTLSPPTLQHNRLHIPV